MIENIDKVLDRGERIENLSYSSEVFSRSSSFMHRSSSFIPAPIESAMTFASNSISSAAETISNGISNIFNFVSKSLLPAAVLDILSAQDSITKKWELDNLVVIFKVSKELLLKSMPDGETQTIWATSLAIAYINRYIDNADVNIAINNGKSFIESNKKGIDCTTIISAAENFLKENKIIS